MSKLDPGRVDRRSRTGAAARFITAAALFVAALCATAPAGAQDVAARATARELAEEGLAAYDAGNYEVAARKLGQAYEVVKVSTLALHTGRALEKLGRWVEAAELYLEATRLEAGGTDVELQAQARADAAAAREALLPRIPRLAVGITGAAPEAVEVTIDGVLVPPSLLAAGRLVNPGEHVVAGRFDEQVREERVTSVAGEDGIATLEFTAPASEPPPGGLPPADPAPVVAPPAANRARHTWTTPAAQAERSQRTAGWVALGVGGAGIALGAGTGIALLALRGELDSGDCLDTFCGPTEQSRVDTYNSLRPFPAIGFVAGGAGVIVGAALLATAPKRAAERRVAPWVGWRSAGIAGNF